MVNCVKCNRGQSKLNPGNLCKNCYANPATSSGIGSDIISEDIIQNLPTLPEEWYEKDITELNTGHLVRIMMGLFQPMKMEIKALGEKVSHLETGIEEVQTCSTKNSEKMAELEEVVKEQDNEIKLLKKVILNQQVFMENTHKRELMRNVIITGIPNAPMEIAEASYGNSEEKIALILSEIDENICSNMYSMHAFPAAENRETHVCRVTFDNVNIKMAVINNAKKLKSKPGFERIYVKWDEPKLTRKENLRLWKKMKEIKTNHPDDSVELKHGIIRHNNVECDKFSLMNQIF